MIWGGADVITVEIKCTVNVTVFEQSRNHPPPQSVEKMPSMKSVPGARKVGDCCLRSLSLPEIIKGTSHWMVSSFQELSYALFHLHLISQNNYVI